MEQREIAKAIRFINSDAKFELNGNEIIWQEENEKVLTDKEIEAGWIAYQAVQAAEAEAKATAKATAQTKLAALGLTVEDLQALGL
jgi:hypothetical protein